MVSIRSISVTMGFKTAILLTCLLVVLLGPSSSEGTLSKSSKKNKKVQSSELKKLSGPQSLSVHQRGLVVETLKWKDVVENHGGYHPGPSTTRNTTTLAYVTPWNNRGYDIAKWQAGRFSHVSPVWLQLRRGQAGGGAAGWSVTGLQDVDQGWMKDVRDAAASMGRTTKILPRLLVEGWSAAQFQALVDDRQLRARLATDLLQLIQDHLFDGLVLEVWSQLPARSLLASMPAVIAELSDSIRAAGHTVVLVIPPAVYQKDSPGFFQASQFSALVDHVDFFSLMTYDFSSLQNPGPNSPVWWMQQCVEALVPDPTSPHRSKLLLGLNLYGLDHSVTGGSHLLGPQLISILETHKPKIKYDDKSAEHFFEYKSPSGRRTVFYPSLFSLQQRLQLAAALNTGLSLWEIGQGLDYFYDLL